MQEIRPSESGSLRGLAQAASLYVMMLGGIRCKGRERSWNRAAKSRPQAAFRSLGRKRRCYCSPGVDFSGAGGAVTGAAAGAVWASWFFVAK